MLVVTVVALFRPYLCYPLMLLDVTQRFRALKNVVKAIKSNVRTLIYTLILLLVIIYIYAVFSFSYFRDDFQGVSYIHLRTLPPKPSKCTVPPFWTASSRY